MVDYYPKNTDFNSNKKIYEKIFEKDENLGLKFKKLLQNLDTKTILCDLVYISGTSSDLIDLNDSLSFLRYLNKDYKDNNYKFKQTLYDHFKIVRQTMKNDFIHRHVHIFRKLSGHIPQGGDENTPYDENNIKDQISMDKILPRFKRLGTPTPKQFNKAFHV